MNVAIFTEGPTEAIVTKHILAVKYAFNVDINIIWLGGRNTPKLLYGLPNPASTRKYNIFISGNDSRVVSDIIERYPKMQNIYDRIAGLRDVYSEEYKAISRTVDIASIDEMRRHVNERLSKLSMQEKLHFHFSVMEVEAWILAMPNIFSKYKPLLTSQYIKEKLKLDLETMAVEEIYHPSNTINTIFELIPNLNYSKNLEQVEAITSNIDEAMLDALLIDERIPNFHHYCDSIFC